MIRLTRVGLGALGVIAMAVFLLGFFLGTRAQGTQASDRAPSVNEAEWSGFTPSDAPPQSLPSGTVTYEIYDSAAHMRYWVFRWPEGGGYSVVPRIAQDEHGAIVPYQP